MATAFQCSGPAFSRLAASNIVKSGASAPKFHLPFVRKSLGRTTRRALQTIASTLTSQINDFAFAFDIDGVLLRSSKPLSGAKRALKYLQSHRIPFILLTNGGGKHESDRVSELSERLGVPLDTGLFVQSHTPFADFVYGNERQKPLKDACILVTGGYGDRCREIAEKYGFTNVVTPADLVATCHDIWPFSKDFNYAAQARPLPKRVARSNDDIDCNVLKIDAVFIYNDPRDWALDTQIILDLLLSHKGYLGTVSALNNDHSLPNRGYQQDQQPPLYFSNPDLLWAAAWHLPRLGQGGFRESLEGVWRAVTDGADLQKIMFGKPNEVTYAFAEKKLEEHRKVILKEDEKGGQLHRVYMVGDNPASDIQGANEYKSSQGSEWRSILVRSGVYDGTKPPSVRPDIIVDDVWDAVQWGLKSSGWKPPDQVMI
ncbi:hypothetical protein MMC13_003220 [Lambiella insularis]|nr:hypothetical protein [Lambiella insularis]